MGQLSSVDSGEKTDSLPLMALLLKPVVHG